MVSIIISLSKHDFLRPGFALGRDSKYLLNFNEDTWQHLSMLKIN